MTKSNKGFKIVDGPTVAGLKRAFCDALGENDCSTRFSVDTGIAVGTAPTSAAVLANISVKLMSLGYEGGCGTDFIFGGHITRSDNSLPKDLKRGDCVRGYYNAKKREGRIKAL
jgi:hypothetical protein